MAEGENTGPDIWLLAIDGNSEPVEFARTPAIETMPCISPNGRWLAYTSSESGRMEVIVQAFPEPGGKHQISANGGSDPMWSSDGSELFYLEGDRMMVVSVPDPDTDFRASRPILLFDAAAYLDVRNFRGYDISSRDGRFLMVKNREKSEVEQLEIVLNWFEELDRLTASK